MAEQYNILAYFVFFVNKTPFLGSGTYNYKEEYPR